MTATWPSKAFETKGFKATIKYVMCLILAPKWDSTLADNTLVRVRPELDNQLILAKRSFWRPVAARNLNNGDARRTSGLALDRN